MYRRPGRVSSGVQHGRRPTTAGRPTTAATDVVATLIAPAGLGDAEHARARRTASPQREYPKPSSCAGRAALQDLVCVAPSTGVTGCPVSAVGSVRAASNDGGVGRRCALPYNERRRPTPPTHRGDSSNPLLCGELSHGRPHAPPQRAGYGRVTREPLSGFGVAGATPGAPVASNTSTVSVAVRESPLTLICIVNSKRPAY